MSTAIANLVFVLIGAGAITILITIGIGTIRGH